MIFFSFKMKHIGIKDFFSCFAGNIENIDSCCVVYICLYMYLLFRSVCIATTKSQNDQCCWENLSINQQAKHILLLLHFFLSDYHTSYICAKNERERERERGGGQFFLCSKLHQYLIWIFKIALFPWASLVELIVLYIFQVS